METEKLEGSEAFKCEACKRCCPHTKRLQMWRPPQVHWVAMARGLHGRVKWEGWRPFA